MIALHHSRLQHTGEQLAEHTIAALEPCGQPGRGLLCCAGKGKTLFEVLCDLQRQAQHFLTVLQAPRSSPASAVDRSCGADMEHADDESTAMQMAELIMKVHGYAHLPPATDPVTQAWLCLLGIHGCHNSIVT